MTDTKPNSDRVLPILRPLEVVPFEHESGNMYFALRDPAMIAPEPIAVSGAAYFVLAHLDGRHTLQQVQEAFRAQAGLQIPAEQIESLVQTLDEACMLRTARFDEACAQRTATYRALPTRDNRSRYPSRDALLAEIERTLANGVPAEVDGLRGLVAPHLDYGRGKPCYADAYATLRRGGLADRYVILGTNHAGLSMSLVATEKDFETPLGRVETDRAFIAELGERLDTDLCTYEADHAAEHSIELQVQLLQATHDGGRPVRIVPLLCPDVCGPTGTASYDGSGPDLSDVALHLGRMIADDDDRTVIIASSDLSHVGQHFGDEAATTAERLREVAETDNGLLDVLASDDPAGFAKRLIEQENATRVCSTGSLWLVRSTLAGADFRLLRYHQAANMEAETHVTCAAAVLV